MCAARKTPKPMDVSWLVSEAIVKSRLIHLSDAQTDNGNYSIHCLTLTECAPLSLWVTRNVIRFVCTQTDIHTRVWVHPCIPVRVCEDACLRICARVHVRTCTTRTICLQRRVPCTTSKLRSKYFKGMHVPCVYPRLLQFALHQRLFKASGKQFHTSYLAAASRVGVVNNATLIANQFRSKLLFLKVGYFIFLPVTCSLSARCCEMHVI